VTANIYQKLAFVW